MIKLFPVKIAKLGWLSNVVGMYFVNAIFLPIGHRALSPVGWQGLQIVLPTRKKMTYTERDANFSEKHTSSKPINFYHW